MAVRFQFVPGREPPDLLGLPWAIPLAGWDDPRLVRMVRGPEPPRGALRERRGAGLRPVDVVAIADRLEERYRLLWDELTGSEEVDAREHHLIERRLRRLNHLGFDVDELVVEHDAAVDRLRIRPAVVEEGHHCRELRRLTGLEVQENQARRLLNDTALASYLESVLRFRTVERVLLTEE